ncbi:sodium-independent sulfate anion transporter-like [Pectinophora gossypiella]|uniref:sodium-independent sulfate anion transporter-like n=1 Tax=Pectinophora gossypiella TaxID=13191 RepID=UPI00214E16B9|nr:sodium-independent sulfate anion transporter-like [Pectinophora gossypiella]
MEPDSWSWAASGGKRGSGRWRAAARRRLPVLRWAPQYSRTAALADLVAGVTLGLTLVPQSIAYAALANLPVQYGLYSSFVGTMLYVVLGTVKEVSIGPTSLTALLTLQTCHGLPVQYVVLLTFLSGCVVLAMGLLRLGFLVELISPAVTSGFTSGTALIIVVAQLKGLLGISFLAESLLDNVAMLAENIHKTRLGDAALGASCCIVLLLLRKLKDVRVGEKRRALRLALWLASIGRNALVVCGAAGLAYCTADAGSDHHPLFKLSGRVEPGLPPLGLPSFGMSSANGTLTFLDMARRISSGVLMLPVVMVLANIAIAKAFSAGAAVDATQEMVTLGLCNMLGSLVHAMPTCGAFTRSAVSHSSGVRTPLAGLYAGVISLVALAFMTQYFYYIPRACLSAVLICAVIFMIDYRSAVVLWRRSRPELAVLVLTLLVAVLGSVELALLCGALGSLARVLRHLMRPPLHLAHYKTARGPALVARPVLALVYAGADRACARLRRAAARAAPRPLLVDCRDLSLLDYSAAQALERLIKELQASGQQLIFFHASAEVLRKLENIEGVQHAALRAASVGDALAAAAAAPAPTEAPAPATAAAPATADAALLAATDDANV